MANLLALFNNDWSKENIQWSYLDALLILQSPLENPQHRINLQVHHQVRAASEDPICTFSQPSTFHTPLRSL